MALKRIIEEQRYRKTRATGLDAYPVVASDLNPVIDVVNALSANITPPKIYRAKLYQSGTNAPIAYVQENTLGGTLVWTYTDVGKYTATLTGAFPTETQTLINCYNSVFDTQTGLYWVDANSLELDTNTLANVPTNNHLTYASVEILVYS